MLKIFKLSAIVILLGLISSNFMYAQWQNADGPEGGGITCFTTQDTTIFIGTVSGVYNSTDNGLIWTNTSNGLPTTFIYDLYTTPNSIFQAHTKEYFVQQIAVRHGLRQTMD